MADVNKSIAGSAVERSIRMYEGSSSFVYALQSVAFTLPDNMQNCTNITFGIGVYTYDSAESLLDDLSFASITSSCTDEYYGFANTASVGSRDDIINTTSIKSSQYSNTTKYFYFCSNQLQSLFDQSYVNVSYYGYITFTIGGASYTITYHVNGGTSIPSETGSTIPDPLPPCTKTHFVLWDWYIGTANSCDYTTLAEPGEPISADTHLWAQWSPAGTYIKGSLTNHVREYYKVGNNHR